MLKKQVHGYVDVCRQQLKNRSRAALWLTQRGTIVFPVTAGNMYLHGICPRRKLYGQFYFVCQ
jgi:hypothetical protein